MSFLFIRRLTLESISICPFRTSVQRSHIFYNRNWQQFRRGRVGSPSITRCSCERSAALLSHSPFVQPFSQPKMIFIIIPVQMATKVCERYRRPGRTRAWAYRPRDSRRKRPPKGCCEVIGQCEYCVISNFHAGRIMLPPTPNSQLT
jgi:hypothetical protein